MTDRRTLIGTFTGGLAVERRFAERNEQFPALAAELVHLKVDVIVTRTGALTQAAKAATSTIPIVMAGVADPVGRGLAPSLARPGGNVTGIANLQVDLYSKRVELLKSAVPKIARVVSIGNPKGVRPHNSAVCAAARGREDSIMDRREFISVAACGLLGMSVPAAAQQAGQIRRIGALSGGAIANPIAPLSARLRHLGWVEGQNLITDARGADGRAELVAGLAAELVQRRVEVIVAFGAVAAVAAKNATTTIPIVASTGDPIRLGLVTSMSRPGGNITGLSAIAPELAAKRLKLLRVLLPKATRIGEIYDPGNQYWQLVRKEYEEVFRLKGMEPIFVEMADPAALDQAFAQLTRQRAEVLIVRGDPVFFAARDQIIGLAQKHALPTMAESRPFVTAGGLVSYGPDLLGQINRIAALVDKILKGAKPGELPIEQPTKLQFVINLKTGKALGIAVPQSLLLRADEVIQ